MVDQCILIVFNNMLVGLCILEIEEERVRR